MVDPIKSIQPISATHQQAEQHPAWVETVRQGILTPDISLANRRSPIFISGVVGEDGSEMTLERRQQIAASRKVTETTYYGDPDYRTAEFPDLGKTEQLGESADRLRPNRIMIMPAHTVSPAEAAEEMTEAMSAAAAEHRMNGKPNE